MKKLLIATGVLLISAVFAIQPRAASTDQFNDEQEKAIESIVRSYLLKNPELLEEVIAELQTKRESEAAIARRPHLEDLYDPTSRYDRFSIGDGEIIVVEFMDYNCGACRQAYSILSEISEQDDVEVRFAEFPILGPMSVVASQAAIASANQDKYAEFHDALMRHPGRIDSRELIMSIAKEVGLDMEQLKADMEAPETQELIEKHLKLADTIGVQGTPAIFVGDTIIPGVPPDLRERLQAAVAEARENCATC